LEAEKEIRDLQGTLVQWEYQALWGLQAGLVKLDPLVCRGLLEALVAED